MIQRFKPALLSASCLFALLGLGVSLAHFVAPSPLAFMMFMTVGQGSLVVAMGFATLLIVSELRRRKVL